MNQMNIQVMNNLKKINKLTLTKFPNMGLIENGEETSLRKTINFR